jgi:mannose-6-phosphate isomerase-like protein (cupin superfamily)
MMEGEERDMLHGAVWEDKTTATDMQEVELCAGDALFIPKGWWHSIKSKQSDGRLNGSVNWWFR